MVAVGDRNVRYWEEAERLLTGTPRTIAEIARHCLFPKTVVYRERWQFLKTHLSLTFKELEGGRGGDR